VWPKIVWVGGGGGGPNPTPSAYSIQAGTGGG